MLLISCASISLYDQKAYEQAVSLKVESLALMSKAIQPYSEHQKQAENLMIEVEKAYEYAKWRPKNEISAKQWEILKDPDGNLLGGFMKKWQRDSRLSPVFVENAKGLVASAFNKIIELESAKIKSSGQE